MKRMAFSLLSNKVILRTKGKTISDFITNRKDGKYCIEILSEEDNTALQHRYYRLLVNLMKEKSGNHKVYCHGYLKSKFLDLEIEIDESGEKTKIIPSTGDIDKEVFSKFINDCYEFMLGNDWAPMTPKEYYDSLFK